MTSLKDEQKAPMSESEDLSLLDNTLKEWSSPSKMLVGDYNYSYLCMPRLIPWSRRYAKPPPFYAKEEVLSLFVGALMGLQHCLAMVGGIITPPLLVSLAAQNLDTQYYLISAALIVSGICTIFQVSRFKIPIPGFPIYIGSGLLSVMGTSFTFLPITQTSIATMQSEDNLSFNDAYGKMLGSFALCALLEILLAQIPPPVLKKVFPPVVSGATVILIGTALTGTGLRYWGGGVFCSSNPVPCGGNGDVKLLYGSSEYVGLGAIVFLALVLIELFGSPFLRNIQVVLALLIGYLVSALVTKDDNHYVNDNKIESADAITFLWVERFSLGIYGPAIIPLLIAYVVTTVETIGDISATEEASGLAPEGPAHMARIKGGLLGDGLSSIFSALATSMPNTTFSQNNGVISLTRCASRMAGIWCGIWLILFGVLAKIGAFFTTIPDCVLGGMTTFLFANVVVSGIKVLAMTKLERRERFILAVALGLGIGVSIVPGWATNNLWPVTEDMSKALKGFRDGVIITLSTGYSIGCLAAIALHLLLPHDIEEEEPQPQFVTEASNVHLTAEGYPSQKQVDEGAVKGETKV
eukprot:TRINITY_DN916_c1_g1_i1.p1 TRINITY_DN916_c1_g1~~TRINITY_DN916_c1_g1_i1.p1  ORF type:complete len:581 (-),score=60.91 TRINITY_DN916_c1_g1_i1:347-2089(-)